MSALPDAASRKRFMSLVGALTSRKQWLDFEGIASDPEKLEDFKTCLSNIAARRRATLPRLPLSVSSSTTVVNGRKQSDSKRHQPERSGGPFRLDDLDAREIQFSLPLHAYDVHVTTTSSSLILTARRKPAQ